MAMKAFLLATSLTLVPSTPDAKVCHLRIGLGIACATEENGPENAADLFQAYGMNVNEIEAQATRNYLNRFLCARVIDHGQGVPIKLMPGIFDIAEPKGAVTVRQFMTYSAAGSQVMWMAESYLRGRCAIEGQPTMNAIF